MGQLDVQVAHLTLSAPSLRSLAATLTAAFLMTGPASACTLSEKGPGEGPSRVEVDSPPSDGGGPDSQEEEPTPVLVGSPLISKLWRPIDNLRPLRTALPARLDLSGPAEMQSLQADPVPSAVLAVGTDPVAFGVSEVALLTPGGEWRLVDRRAMGMRNPQIVEQQFELSPDGRRLALADEGGIWITDLSTAESTRIPTDVLDPVLHGWLDGGVIFTRRGGVREERQKTWLADPASETAVLVHFDGWKSAVGANGILVEFMSIDHPTSPYLDDGLSRFRIVGQSEFRKARSMDKIMTGAPRVAKRWDYLIGAAQSGDGSGTWRPEVAMGVSAFDPKSAQTVAFLRLPAMQAMRTTPLGPVGDRWILLQTAYGPGGGLFAWDPERRKLRGVTAIDEEYAVLSVAFDLLEVPR